LKVLEAAIHCTGYTGNEFQLFIAGTRRIAEQAKHFRHLIKTLALCGEVHVGIGIRCRGIDIAPQEMAELVHHRPEMFHQTFIQKAIQNVVLVLVTGMSKGAPLQLQSQGAELSSQAVYLIRKVSHFSSLTAYSTHLDARKVLVRQKTLVAWM
jgi:hypothetical protein